MTPNLPITTAAPDAPTLSRSHAPTSSRPAFLFTIPPDQAAAHSHSLSDADLANCRRLLSVLERIHTAPKILPACKRLSAQLNQRWSESYLRTKYYQFTGSLPNQYGYAAGDWRICLNHAKAPIHRQDLDSVSRRPAFIEFWRRLGERFHQDWAAAHDELLKIWRTGYDSLGKRYPQIPGYATYPEADPFFGHPAGWSYANLMRYQSDPYDQVAARIGHAKASAHRLPVLTTRVGLQFGQFLEFDDHEFNQRVLFQKKPMRPLGFGCVEVLSACICHMGLKPTLWDYEEEMKRRLTEREFMWFVISVLTTLGYRADLGTTLIGERGTSKLAPAFVERLAKITGDKISWYVGGRFGKPAHAGQFEGRSKGNYRTKKLVEGSWALVDNQTAMLPAQTGRGRDDAPEGFTPKAGAEQYTGRIIRAADAAIAEGRLTPEQAAQLQFPYPYYWQWQTWALDAIARINRDPNHDLEGWEKLGFVQPTWRLPLISTGLQPGVPASADALNRFNGLDGWLPWQAFLALPEPQRSVVKAMMDADPTLVKPARLSRQQVFDAHRAQLTPLPWELLPALVGPDHALSTPLEVRQGLLRFECADIDPDPVEFYARDYRASAGNFLPNGEKYVCFVNPYAPTHLVACSVHAPRSSAPDALRVVAVCPRYIRACRTDEQAVQKLMGDQQAFEAAARVRLNLRHSDEAAAKQNMFAHNARLLGAAAATPAVPPAPPAPADDCTNDLLTREHAEPSAGEETDSWD